MDKFVIRTQRKDVDKSYQVMVSADTYSVLKDLKKRTGLQYSKLIALMVDFCTDPRRLVIEEVREIL